MLRGRDGGLDPSFPEIGRPGKVALEKPPLSHEVRLRWPASSGPAGEAVQGKVLVRIELGAKRQLPQSCQGNAQITLWIKSVAAALGTDRQSHMGISRRGAIPASAAISCVSAKNPPIFPPEVEAAVNRIILEKPVPGNVVAMKVSCSLNRLHAADDGNESGKAAKPKVEGPALEVAEFDLKSVQL